MLKERKASDTAKSTVIADGMTLGIIGAGVMGQTLAKGLNLSMAVAEKQVLSTNFSTTFNAASIGQIENDMKEFGIITTEPPASSLIWNP